MFGFVGKNPKSKASIAYDSAALSWFSYASITDVAEKNAFNTFVLTAKAQGWWTKLGYYNYISPTSYSAAKKDCVGLTTGTEYGGMNSSFWSTGSFGGFLFNGAGWLDTGFNPSIVGIITSTKASMGSRSANGLAGSGVYVMGCNTGATSGYWLHRGVAA